jgi:hypothetical protein
LHNNNSGERWLVVILGATDLWGALRESIVLLLLRLEVCS